MREIAIMSFVELSKEAQLNVVKDNREHVAKSVIEYIREIWNEYVEELSDVLTPGLKVSYTMNEYTLEISFNDVNIAEPNTIWLTDGCTGQGIIIDAIKKLRKTNTWFADDVEEFNKETAFKGPFIHWCYKLYNKIITDMYIHYIKMMSDPEYVIKYINEEIPTDYIAPDTIFNDWEFTTDGRVFTMG